MFQANFADRRAIVMSEDCLYLNVWTPDPSSSERLPVMVWVHGGGNRFGYGSQDAHDGRSLARRGIVVVTLNYRLGALGFLAHPELSRTDPDHVSGNYGLLDVIAAMQWVQRNIPAFGGDPNRVTAAGNSAGASIVCHLMAAPSGHGLFARAIGQSPGSIFRSHNSPPPLATAETTGQRFAEALGAHSLTDLRRLSAVELTATGQFRLVIDGRTLPRESHEAYEQGEQADIPLLVGSTLDEGTNYTSAAAAGELAGLAASQGDLAPAFREIYPDHDADQARSSARQYTSDSQFIYPVWRWAATHARTSRAPVWVYRFERTPPLPPDLELAPPMDGGPGYGVFHTAEVSYAWDSLGSRPWAWEPVDRTLAAAMSSSWASFVISGDPNGDELVRWDRFSVESGIVMRFGDEIRAGVVDRPDAMRLHDAMRGHPLR